MVEVVIATSEKSGTIPRPSVVCRPDRAAPVGLGTPNGQPSEREPRRERTEPDRLAGAANSQLTASELNTLHGTLALRDSSLPSGNPSGHVWPPIQSRNRPLAFNRYSPPPVVSNRAQRAHEHLVSAQTHKGGAACRLDPREAPFEL